MQYSVNTNMPESSIQIRWCVHIAFTINVSIMFVTQYLVKKAKFLNTNGASGKPTQLSVITTA